jgi:hypothetical protein
MIKQIIWDTDNDEEAMNCNGEPVIIDGGEVVVESIGCNCDPDNACGSCIPIWNRFEIGNSQYIHKFITI